VLFLDDPVDRQRQPRLGLAFGRVGQAEVGEDAGGAVGDGGGGYRA
jgi:hypothetical protein